MNYNSNEKQGFTKALIKEKYKDLLHDKMQYMNNNRGHHVMLYECALTGTKQCSQKIQLSVAPIESTISHLHDLMEFSFIQKRMHVRQGHGRFKTTVDDTETDEPHFKVS